MPYLKDPRRKQELTPVGLGIPRDPGELNFAITALMQTYVEVNGGASYSVLAEALSGPREAEAEFRRRVLVPYEDRKIKENGDVFGD